MAWDTYAIRSVIRRNVSMEVQLYCLPMKSDKSNLYLNGLDENSRWMVEDVINPKFCQAQFKC